MLERGPRIHRVEVLPAPSAAYHGILFYQRADNQYYQVDDAGTAWTGINGIELPIDDSDVTNTSGWLAGTARTVFVHIGNFWDAIVAHYPRTDNPHAVTYSQVGADVAGAAVAVMGVHNAAYVHGDIALNAMHRGLTTNPHNVDYTQTGGEASGTAAGIMALHNAAFVHADIALNTADRHTQGTDLGLDNGGVNPVTAAAIVNHLGDTVTDPHGVRALIDWVTNVPANETDPAWTAWLAGPPNVSEFSNDAGYLISESDTLDSVCDRGNTTDKVITAANFVSSVAVGASPYACTSTTLNTNLNADLWDGYEFADYLDQAVKQVSSPQFANLVITQGGHIRPTADSTTALNIAQADGTDWVIFDTTNKSILISDGAADNVGLGFIGDEDTGVRRVTDHSFTFVAGGMDILNINDYGFGGRSSCSEPDQNYIFYPEFHNLLFKVNYRADVTLTNFTDPWANFLFDNGYESYSTNKVGANTSAKIEIDLTAKGEYPSGILYPYGYIYFVFYGGTQDEFTTPGNVVISGRVYSGGAWHNLANAELINPGRKRATYKMRIGSSVGAYCTNLEFTITVGAIAIEAGLTEIEWHIALKDGGDIRPLADSASALKITNAAGIRVVTFDTTGTPVSLTLHYLGSSNDVMLKLRADNSWQWTAQGYDGTNYDLVLNYNRNIYCGNYYIQNNGTTITMVDMSNARFGVNTTAPGMAAEINSATGDCLRLTYNDATGNAVVKVDQTISAAGVFTIAPDNGGTPVSVLLPTTTKLTFRDASIGIYSQADSFIDLFVDGGFRVGDSSAGAPTNYSMFAPDGIMTMHGTARVKRGQWYDAGAIRAPGAKPATLVAHGVLETPAWSFANQAVEGNQETISVNLKLEEDMDRSVAPTFLIGWSADGADAGDCEWQLEYLWTESDEDTGAAAQATVTAIDSASATADGLTMTEITGIVTPSATDMCMHCRLTRLSASVNDTIAIAVHLHGVCSSYTSNKLGAPL